MRYKKTTTLAVLISSVMLLSAFMPQQEHKAKNLQVLPKDISHEELDKVMDGFKTALGVRCGYCHAPRKDDPKKMDFASDDNPKKEVARDMMRMTNKINKKYFHDKDQEGMVTNISCISCHNGKEEPVTIKF